MEYVLERKRYLFLLKSWKIGTKQNWHIARNLFEIELDNFRISIRLSWGTNAQDIRVTAPVARFCVISQFILTYLIFFLQKIGSICPLH